MSFLYFLPDFKTSMVLDFEFLDGVSKYQVIVTIKDNFE